MVTVANDKTKGGEMIPGHALVVVTILLTAVVILADVFTRD